MRLIVIAAAASTLTLAGLAGCTSSPNDTAQQCGTGATGTGTTSGTGGATGTGTTSGTGATTTSTSSTSTGTTTSSTTTTTSTTTHTGTGGGSPSMVFGPYKDVGINMNWNTNVISTEVSGAMAPIGTDLPSHGGKSISLAFATGECGSENWAGVEGGAMATANASLLDAAGLDYIVSTGGEAGSFTCGTDAGMETFIGRWATPHLVGIDFDIEAGQSQEVISDLISRIQAAHTAHPGLRFSLTLGTLAPGQSGSAVAMSLGASAQDSFNVYGDDSLAAVESTLGFDGTAATWPSYLTVNLMTMDYGGASDSVCVVSGGTCQMGQSALQAAYNLHDHWGVPYSAIELTPMIGQNDASDEKLTLADADTIAAFALAQGLAGVHYWSYDRDVDCAAGSASSTCSSMGAGYAGPAGYLQRFSAGGL
jgi:chitinase